MGRKRKEIGAGNVKGPAGSQVTQLPDGTLCIGNDCSRIRIPPKGDVELDLSDCPEDVRKTILKKYLNEGGVQVGIKITKSENTTEGLGNAITKLAETVGVKPCDGNDKK